MADEQVVIESAATPEVQAEAEKQGWIPPTRYKGDAERFVDADEYIKRGETVLPIVKEHNKRLKAELEAVKAEGAAQAAALKKAQEAIEQIEERHTVATQKAVERARSEVKAQLAKASEAGDHEGVAELTEQLVQLREAEVTPPVAAKPVVAPAAYVPPPDMKEWNEENPWFGKDRRKTSLALGIAQELREGGEKSTGRAFYDRVSVEMEKVFPKEEPRTNKVETARGGSGEGPRSGGRKSFSALPAEAKAACLADQKQFVGPNKRFQTAEAWQSRYAELYFQE